MIRPANPTISRRSLLRLAAALPLAGGFAALEAAEPRITVPPYNTLTDQEEIAFGRKVAVMMEKQMPMLNIGLIDDYVDNMVKKLGRASQRPNMDYSAKVVNTRVVNAKSILGGHTYVYRGLLQFIDSEAELAAVLGHEVGHVVGHHSADNIMLQVQARKLYELVKNNVLLQNNIIQQVIEKLGGPLAVLAMMRYQRSQEFEADMLGFYEMLRCNWDPNMMVHLFQHLETLEGKPTFMKAVLSDHPPSGERAARIRAEMQTVRIPSRVVDNSFEFRAMKLALSALPPPPKEESKG